jgi:vitamin B12 transporter
MSILRLRAAALAAALVAGPAYAAETEAIGEVTVTAERVPTRQDRTGASVTVLAAEDLHRRGATSVIEVLQQEAGIHLHRSGPTGTATSIRMRGTESTHTLVLVDGVRVHSNTLGTANLQHITVDQVERIEIVRGPQSPLYGSDAIGGVVQIITKRAAGTEGFVAYEGGRFHTNEVRFGAGSAWNDGSLSVGGSWHENRGFSVFNDRRGGVEADGYKRRVASGRYESRRPFVDLDLVFRYADGNVENDQVPGDGLANRFSRARETLVSVGLARDLGARWGRHTARFGAYQDDLEGRAAAAFRIISTTRSAEYQGAWTIRPNVRLVAGFEHEKRIGENVGTFDRQTTTNAGYGNLLADVDLLGGDLAISAGGRHDGHSTFGTANTWRTAFSYAGRRPAWGDVRTRIFGTYGTGFNAPTFNQLFFPGFGNPNLRPEESKGWDAGAEVSSIVPRVGPATLRAAYFENRVNDLIQFAPTPMNVARSIAEGIEISGTLRPAGLPGILADRVRLAATYTYLEPRDRTTNLLLPRRPRNAATANVRWNPTDRIALDYFYRYAGHTFSAAGEAQRVEKFHLSAVRASYLWRDAEVWLRVENLFGRDYEEIFNFGTSPRAYYGGVRYDF